MRAEFENQLQRQPVRELPRDWRAQILAAASAPQPEGSTWPSLRAWAALAAVWLVILLLHSTAPDEPRLARNASPMTMQSFAILHEQTLMIAQLLGQTDAAELPVALPPPSKPRSEMPRKQLIG